MEDIFKNRKSIQTQDFPLSSQTVTILCNEVNVVYDKMGCQWDLTDNEAVSFAFTEMDTATDYYCSKPGKV